jgi:hypothetical protein
VLIFASFIAGVIFILISVVVGGEDAISGVFFIILSDASIGGD